MKPKHKLADLCRNFEDELYALSLDSVENFHGAYDLDEEFAVVADAITGRTGGAAPTVEEIKAFRESGAVVGTDYRPELATELAKELAKVNFADPKKPTAAEVKNLLQDVDATTRGIEVYCFAASLGGATPTVEEIKAFCESGAVVGTDDRSELAKELAKELANVNFADLKKPTAAEVKKLLQAVVDRVNAAKNVVAVVAEIRLYVNV